jgi:mannose-6-phosphate isomerase-like protein (cupin superfamily)
MKIADLNDIAGRRYPAKRHTQSVVGNGLPIEAHHFCMGHVTLDPMGGQVPWHNHDQEEVYFIIEGTGQLCVDDQIQEVHAGQWAYVQPHAFHQLTNIGTTPLRMIYCYAPSGEVAHWRQELAGTLPKAGVDAPPLPEGAWPQCTDKPQE